MSYHIDKSKLYQKLFESFKKSHTGTKVQNVQKLVNEVWRNYKLQAKTDKELDIIVSKRIEEELQAATKNKSNLLHFFSKATSSTSKPAEKTQIIQPFSNIEKQKEDKIKTGNESQEQCENNDNADKQRAKPSQEALKNKITLLEKNLNALYSARDTMPNCAEVDKQIIKLREELKTAKNTLNRKIQNVVAQKKHRDGMKRKLEDICQENPEIKRRLSLRDSVGHPKLERESLLVVLMN
ncbi:uncharacterized protein LOC126367090 [Pectinophora gossypiella]|uniref:uncharacterized protein LOC126367090 n=1 Tax=Pectinophora gossypiella TaxID=13191 RepID=UPI00214E1C3D|nr:uncharacterized protein LOC126367090 [Pectinophora gossypiella]